MEREQIIKALECCHSAFIADCKQCPYKGKADYEEDLGITCLNVLLKDALSLIKELTEVAERREDIEKSPVDCSTPSVTELQRENERLRAEKEAAIEDLEHCMYFAKPKRPNTCNFCTHDCEVSKDGTRCKGKDDWIYCSPVWRGVVKPKAEGE